MTSVQPASANAAQFEHWNGSAGDTWTKLHAFLDNQLAPLGRAAMDRLSLHKAEHVLDIGCGTGATSLELAERVGRTGRVLGVDLSQPMLTLARQRAERVPQLSFAQADAQLYPFAKASFDAVFSRFGIMFFADPVAAFANLRAALKPGGWLAFAAWRPARENEWVAVPMAAAFEHMPRPPAPEPGAPGEFAFADAERVRRILEAAGFRDIALEPYDQKIGGASLERTLDTTLQMGPVAAMLREASPETRDRVAASLRKAFAPFAGPDGVRMGAAIWIVTARQAKGS